jgi:hypothetical protein
MVNTANFIVWKNLKATLSANKNEDNWGKEWKILFDCLDLRVTGWQNSEDANNIQI